MANYRHGAVFVLDPRECSTPLDRNQRARILAVAEHLERASKAYGRRNGALGHVGLAILRALLLRFAHGTTGLCAPSYDSLQRVTGLCRQSISNGLKRLVAVGLLRITRRLVRVAVNGEVRCQQGSNLYRFPMPTGPLPVPAFPAGSVRQFKAPVPVPHRGSIGDLISAVLGRESTGQGESSNSAFQSLPRPTRGEPDWRGTARTEIQKKMQHFRRNGA